MPLKWMIWRYPHFRKPPYLYGITLFQESVHIKLICSLLQTYCMKKMEELLVVERHWLVASVSTLKEVVLQGLSESSSRTILQKYGVHHHVPHDKSLYMIILLYITAHHHTSFIHHSYIYIHPSLNHQKNLQQFSRIFYPRPLLRGGSGSVAFGRCLCHGFGKGVATWQWRLRRDGSLERWWRSATEPLCQ